MKWNRIMSILIVWTILTIGAFYLIISDSRVQSKIAVFIKLSIDRNHRISKTYLRTYKIEQISPRRD